MTRLDPLAGRMAFISGAGDSVEPGQTAFVPDFFVEPGRVAA